MRLKAIFLALSLLTTQASAQQLFATRPTSSAAQIQSIRAEFAQNGSAALLQRFPNDIVRLDLSDKQSEEPWAVDIQLALGKINLRSNGLDQPFSGTTRIIDQHNIRSLILSVNGIDQLVTNDPYGGIIGSLHIENPRAIGADTGITSPPPCGFDSENPASHCALFAITLYDNNIQSSADFGNQLCSGVLISKRHILTAAHCLCDAVGSQNNPKLSETVSAYIGDSGMNTALNIDYKTDVNFYPGTGRGACTAGDIDADRQRRGDLAIITLTGDTFADATTWLTAQGVNNAEIGKTLVTIGATGFVDWTTKTENRFAVFSWGNGPDKVSQYKRAMMYRLDQLLAPFAGDTTGVQEARFDEIHRGLCAGDSGGGVFKQTISILDGYSGWSVVGIISGGPESSTCHNGTELLEKQHPRTIVRLDNKAVIDWISAATGGEAKTANTRRDFAIQIAASDR